MFRVGGRKKMKKKIVGILVVTLFIASTVLPVVGTMNINRDQDVATLDEPDGFQKPSIGLSELIQLPPFLLQLFNGDWNYWTNSPHMYAIPTGNVGIGTPSPTSKLQVAGNVDADSFTINGIQVGTSNDSYWSEGEEGNIYYDGDVDIDGDLSITGAIDPTWVWFQPQTSAPLDTSVAPKIPLEGTLYYNDTTDLFNVYTGNNYPNGHWTQLKGGDNDWLGLGASIPTITGDIYHQDGNVGIGTTTPYAKLTVQDPDLPFISITADPGTIDATFELAVATQAGYFSNVATPGDVVARTPGGSSEDVIIAARNSNNGAIRFTTGEANNGPKGEIEKMSLVSNGHNKGFLNLTSLQYNSIVGTGYSCLRIYANSDWADGGGKIELLPNTNGWKHGTTRIFSSKDNTNTPQWHGNIEFIHETIASGVATEDLNMIIKGDTGYVGISMDTPKTKLQVNGPIATAINTVLFTTILTDYHITDDDSVIFASLASSSAQGFIYLPPAFSCPGREYTIKNIKDIGVISVVANQSFGDSIDCDDCPEVGVNPCSSIVVVSDGLNHWYIVADYIK